MELIELPLLPFNSPLDSAWGAMRRHQKSAVVGQHDSSYNLVEAGDIVHGLADGFSHLDAVSVVTSVHAISYWEFTQWGLDSNDPYKTEAEYDQFLDRQHMAYAIAATATDMALVIVRQVSDANALNMAPRRCYCKGPHKHRYPPPQKNKGDKCSRCMHDINCV